MGTMLIAAVLGGALEFEPPMPFLLKTFKPTYLLCKEYTLKCAPAEATAGEVAKRFPGAQSVGLPAQNVVLVLADAKTQFNIQKWLADFDANHGPTN